MRALSAGALAGLVLGLAPSASADVGERIILRCTHNESLAGFSQSDYRKALSELSPDTEEYSGCESRIRQAELNAAGGSLGRAASGNPVPIPVTPAEQRAITRAQHVRPGPLRIAGSKVRPGLVHVSVASALSTLPDPLLATLAFLLACLVIIGAWATRKRLRGRTG